LLKLAITSSAFYNKAMLKLIVGFATLLIEAFEEDINSQI